MTEGRHPAGQAALYSNVRVRFPPGRGNLGPGGQVGPGAPFES